MRRAAKIDANQPALVGALRSMGATVEITSSAHDGFPDIVVGYRGVTVLVEIKDGSLAPSKRKLTPAQIELHNRFAGAITIIETLGQAALLIQRMRDAADCLTGITWDMGAIAHASHQKT